MLSKAKVAAVCSKKSAALESVAECSYAIGSDLLEKKSFDRSIRILRVGFDILNENDGKILDQRASDLHLPVGHSLSRAYTFD